MLIALKTLEISWRWLRATLVRRRVQLAQSLRVATASVVALVVAQLMGLPLPLWAVLTAVIVTQLSVGRSLKTTADYLMGTVGGAIYGGAVALVLPHQSEMALLGVLMVAVAPLALFAALRQNMNVVPITAIIVLLLPQSNSPVYSAIYRVLEVGLGASIGLMVSFLVLPSSAHRLMRQAAARALDRMARALVELLGGASHGLGNDELHRLQDGIGQALVEIDIVGAEAERERSARLSSEADTGPLRRTLLRLRHDLVMVGRTVGAPLPATLLERLAPRLAEVTATASAYLQGSAAAVLARRAGLPLEPFERALAGYEAEVTALRQDGSTRALPGDVAERFFALGFGLAQMHRNFADLQRVVNEWGPALERDA